MQKFNETSPKGWTGTVRAMLTHHPELNQDDEKNPYALANWMKKKGYKPHYKDQESSLEGKPEKKKKYKDEDEEKPKKHKKKHMWSEWYRIREARENQE